MSSSSESRSEAADRVIDRMTATRAKNNVAWMTILRIAYQAEPERTMAVIKEIEQHDGAIQSDWRRLSSL